MTTSKHCFVISSESGREVIYASSPSMILKIVRYPYLAILDSHSSILVRKYSENSIKNVTDSMHRVMEVE